MLDASVVTKTVVGRVAVRGVEVAGGRATPWGVDVFEGVHCVSYEVNCTFISCH